MMYEPSAPVAAPAPGKPRRKPRVRSGCPVRVGISGSFGGLNLGDEAILQAMISELRSALPVELTIFSRGAEDTRRRHPVDRVVPVRHLSRSDAVHEVAHLDLFILGGGGLLYDGEAEVYLRELELARSSNVPVMLYAASVGPLDKPSTRHLVRNALNQANVITVRDRQSRHLLEDIGVRREITVTADPAVLLQADPQPAEPALRAEGIDPNACLVGLSVREPGPAAPGLVTDQYHQLIADAADFLAARLGAELVFIPLERRSCDFRHSHAVASRMRYAERAAVLKREYTPNQLVALLRHFQFALGMRLHFLIFSALAEVPFVALPYAAKVEGFLDELGLEYATLRDIGAGQLIAGVDRAWDSRQELRSHIRRGLGCLQERARQTTRLALQLLSTAGHTRRIHAAEPEHA